MSVSLYDVLDVPPDASADEIRAAWRAAVADLDPTDRRFSVYNEAGRVLLDPEQRAAYDAQRAADQETDQEPDPSESEPTESEPTEPEPARSRPAAPPAATASAPSAQDSGRLTRAERRAARQSARKIAKDSRAQQAGPRAPSGRTARVVPIWALVALAVTLVAVVSVSAYLLVAVPSDDAVREASRRAQSSAERAVVPVLSYDYRSLDQDGEAARSWMTDDYAQKYDQLFEQIQESAPQTETVVRTEVVASALVRSGEERVQVLIFVDRPTRNKALEEPVTYKDQVRVTMQKTGDRWLVDQLCTTATCES